MDKYDAYGKHTDAPAEDVTLRLLEQGGDHETAELLMREWEACGWKRH